MIDVVFTDIGLGVGLNGWEVAGEARKMRPEIRVVNICHCRLSRRDVAGSIVPKPYDPSAVLKACRNDSR